jgi:hypothetical protein
MKLVLLLPLLLAPHLDAQPLRPLHVSAEGNILDDSNNPVLLRGLNRSGTGSGNADATATDAATVFFAGLVGPGEFQFNVVVPASLANGDQPITATYGGLTTRPGTLITVHN